MPADDAEVRRDYASEQLGPTDQVTPTLRAEDFEQIDIDLSITVRLVAHPEVFRGSTDEDGWRNAYGFMDRDDVVGHLLFNLLQGRHLSQLDGWADLPAAAAFVDELRNVEINYRSDPEGVPDYTADMIRFDLKRHYERESDRG